MRYSRVVNASRSRRDVPRTPLNVRFAFVDVMVGVTAALIAVSFVTSLPQTLQLYAGSRSVALEAGLGLRWIREALAVVLALLILARIVLVREPLVPYFRNTVAAIALGAYIFFVAIWTLLQGFPPIVPVSGLRVLQYVPVAIVGFALARRSAGDPRSVATWMLAYVLLLAPLAVFQVLVAPPVYGETVLGSRAFAVFSRPNIFGLVLASCQMWFAVTVIVHRGARTARRFAVASFLTFGLILLAGSRTAVVLGVLVLAAPYLARMTVRTRWATLGLVPLMLFAVYAVSSLRFVSGRTGTDALWDPRIGKVFGVGQHLNDLGDLLFGWGLGLTSNTLSTLVGYGRFEGQIIADSQYLSIFGGYGLLGLLAYLVLLALLWRSGATRFGWIVALFVALAGVPFNVLEVYPANVVLLLLWGFALGASGAIPGRATASARSVQPGRPQRPARPRTA